MYPLGQSHRSSYPPPHRVVLRNQGRERPATSRHERSQPDKSSTFHTKKPDGALIFKLVHCCGRQSQPSAGLGRGVLRLVILGAVAGQSRAGPGSLAGRIGGCARGDGQCRESGRRSKVTSWGEGGRRARRRYHADGLAASASLSAGALFRVHAAACVRPDQASLEPVRPLGIFRRRARCGQGGEDKQKGTRLRYYVHGLPGGLHN